MFYRSCASAIIAISLIAVTNTAHAADKSCRFIESRTSIKTRVANAKLPKKKQKNSFTIISKAKACKVLRAASSIPSVFRFVALDARTDTGMSSARALSSSIKLSLPAASQSNAALQVILEGDAPGGLRFIVGPTNTREKGAPYSLFGNIGNDFFGGKLTAGMYPMEIRYCTSQADQNCSTKLFAGTLTMSTAGSVPVTIPPTATPTPTSTPVLPPVASITTLNTVVNGEITGEAPLAVFVKGIMSASDSQNFKKCMDTKIPLSVTNDGYVPLGDPNRAGWEAQGDAKSACLDAIDSEIVQSSSTSLRGNGTFMTAGYSWDFGDTANSAIFNSLSGWNAAHTYDLPGNYVVSLTVTGTNGIPGIVRMPVRVLPSTRRPIYVSEFGNDANDGKSEAAPIKSIAMIAKLTYSKTNVDLFFKRGETFRFTSADPAITFNKANVRVGAYGQASALPILLWTGAKASIGASFFSANHRSSDITFENLHFDTDLKTMFGTTDYHEKDGVPMAISTSGTRILMRNNEILNVSYFASLTPVPACENGVCVTARPTGVLVTKNTAPSYTGIRGYFIWNGSGFQVNAFGNRVENSLREHILRSAGDFELLNAQYNEFRNTAVVDGVDFRKGVFNCQGGYLAYIANNLIHEGPGIFGPLGGNRGIRGEKTRFGKYLSNKYDPMAKNQLRTGKYGDQTAVAIGNGATHILIANNMFNFGNTIAETTLDAAVQIETSSADYNRAPDDIVIAHNTFTSGKGALDKRLLTAWDGYKNVRVANNLIVNAEVVGGDFRTTPIYLSSPTDGLTTPVQGITQMSCNVFPVPATYRTIRTFDSGIHGVNQIGDAFLTMKQWVDKFVDRHGKNGIADSFQNVGVDLVDWAIVPQSSFKASIQCPPFEGITSDYFGAARKGAMVTAGAYELR